MNENPDQRTRTTLIVAPSPIRPQPGWLCALALALALAPGVAVAARNAAGAPPSAETEEATYDRCMALAKTDPAGARDLAEKWLGRGGAHPADHCFAVALIGLEQYKAAAERLDKLAEAMMSTAPAALRAEALDQAGQAWLLSGDPTRAYNDEGVASALLPNDPDLRIDRAEAAGEAGWFDKAIADLDVVLKAAPRRVDALIYRATAYRALDKLDPAYADADAAVRLAPNSAQAVLERGNIRGLKGDVDGARRDWQAAAALAPGSAAALAATANIAQLDKSSKQAPAAH